MATFNYVLGKKKDNGRYPVYLRITNRNTNTTISLDMEVVKSEWNEAGQRISIRRADDYDTRIEKEKNNDFLDSLLIRAKEVEKDLKHRGVLNEMTAAQIKKAILEYSPNAKKNRRQRRFRPVLVWYRYGNAQEPDQISIRLKGGHKLPHCGQGYRPYIFSGHYHRLGARISGIY